MSDWSANPYLRNENFILNGEGFRKETRIVFALGDSGLDYKVGDVMSS